MRCISSLKWRISIWDLSNNPYCSKISFQVISRSTYFFACFRFYLYYKTVIVHCRKKNYKSSLVKQNVTFLWLWAVHSFVAQYYLFFLLYFSRLYKKYWTLLLLHLYIWNKFRALDAVVCCCPERSNYKWVCCFGGALANTDQISVPPIIFLTYLALFMYI